MIDWSNIASWKVLVVDDEPDNLELIAETMAFYGVSTRAAKSAAEGLAILEAFHPTLILMDLSMPKMDGWQMRMRVRENPANQDITIVALTAHAMLGDKERALAAGFDGYLSKPINIVRLIDDLRRTLQEKGSLRMMNWQALVIEDEADSMELVQGILEYHGIRSVGAPTAEEAFKALETKTPDLFIVDLALPGMDGWGFLKQLKSDTRWSHIPRVAVTAYHNPFLAEKAIEAGFQAYFAKPIDATSFVRELQSILETERNKQNSVG
jgi:CheY-like chemotaxis protein